MGGSLAGGYYKPHVPLDLSQNLPDLHPQENSIVWAAGRTIGPNTPQHGNVVESDVALYGSDNASEWSFFYERHGCTQELDI